MDSELVLRDAPAPLAKPYDPTEEEPDFELAIECLRQIGARYPHSQWRYGFTINGKREGEPSQTERDYIAAVLRHIASVVQGQIAAGDNRAEQMIAFARMSKIEAKLAARNCADAVLWLTEHADEQYAASVLGLKVYQVRAILNSRKPLALVER